MPPEWGGQGKPGDSTESNEDEESESNGYFLKRMNIIIMSILVLIN